MSTVKQHLQKAHEAHATFHRAMSKCHGDAMSKAAAGDRMAEFHKAAQAAHNAAAEAEDSMCEECSKASNDEFNKVVPLPDGLSILAPERRAIPRTGQRELPSKAAVSPMFQKLIESPDEENMQRVR
jgi:hypothetical protein